MGDGVRAPYILNIQDWLQLDEGDSGFRLLTGEEIAAAMFFIYFHQQYLYY
jgi:hypothetical protein